MLPELMEKVRSCESKVGTYFSLKNSDTWDRLLVSTFASKCLAG